MPQESQQYLLAFLLLGALLLLVSGCATSSSINPHDSAPDAHDDQPVVAERPAEVQLAFAEDRLPPDAGLEEVSAEEPVADLWERLRQGFALQDKDHPMVRPDLEWYVKHADYLDRVAERGTPYLHFIVESVEARGMPTEIALLPVVESAFHPFAYSHGRASGIWQFIPGTGRRYGLKQNWWYDGRRDIYESTRAALDYLQWLHQQFDGDWLLALAAYNSGEGTVMRAIRANRQAGKPTDFWHLKLPRETRGYVPKLLALSAVVGAPGDHGVQLRTVDNVPYFVRVEVDSQLDLALAAELAEVDLDELYRLNPAFNRWATDPEGPHHLLLPIAKAEQFEVRLSELPAQRRLRWERHQIAQGETLEAIARKYQTTVATLQQANGLKGHIIRAGQHLIIPAAARDLSTYALSADQRLRANQSKPREGRKLVHVVSKGDTLWNLSRKHGVSVAQLAKWNSMAPRDPLKTGQRLVIWSQAKTAASAPAVLQAPPHRAMTQRIGYKVRKGDSLYRISQRFNVTVPQLLEWNGLSKKDYLRPGQSLTVYVDVTQADI